MQKINFDKRIVIFSLLVIAIVVEFLVLFPWSIKRIVSLNKKISLTVQKIKSTEGDWPRLDEYLKAIQGFKDQIQKNQARFILPHEVSETISFISAAGKKFEVEIKSFLPGELTSPLEESNHKVSYLPISIRADAKFHSLALFLEYLEKSQYFFNVKELEISSEHPYNSVEMVIWAIAEK